MRPVGRRRGTERGPAPERRRTPPTSAYRSCTVVLTVPPLSAE